MNLGAYGSGAFPELSHLQERSVSLSLCLMPSLHDVILEAWDVGTVFQCFSDDVFYILSFELSVIS